VWIMNCDDFAANLKALAADTLDEVTKASMEEHARRCRDCGTAWDEHQQLCTTVQSVLEAHKLPPDLAEDVTGKVYQERFGASFGPVGPRSDSIPAIPWKSPSTSLLLAALAGGLVGYFLAGPRSQSALSQQIAYAQLLGPRSARGGSSELMLYELLGASALGTGGAMGRGLPQITGTIRTVFFVFLLLWLTRTKVWNAVFPARVPGGIYAARWVALLAAIFGLGRCASESYVSLRLFGAMGRGGPNSQLLEQWAPSLVILEQLWAITFWLTLMIVLFTLANRLTLRIVRPPSASPG
jgi:hypothetical protein